MKLLARLTATTANLSPATTGLSSSTPLTRTELADVLAGLSDYQLALIYAIELQDKAAIHQVIHHAWLSFRGYYLTLYLKWPKDNTKHDALFKLVAGLSRLMVAHPHGVFCRCGGDPHCTHCHGTQIRNFTPTELAKATDLSRRTIYTDRVKNFTAEIFKDLHSEYNDALKHIKDRVRAMREDEKKYL